MERLVFTVSGMALNLGGLLSMLVMRDPLLACCFLSASTMVYAFGRTRDSKKIQELVDDKDRLLDLYEETTCSEVAWKLYAETLEKRLDKLIYNDSDGEQSDLPAEG